MAWPVRSAAAQVRLGRTLSETRAHAAERALVNPALRGARKRHAEVLELDHRRHGFTHHVLDRVLNHPASPSP